MVEELWSGIRMQYSAGQFQLSTDSMVLADFCTLPPRRLRPRLRVREPLALLCGKYPQAQLTGMELQEEAAVLAQENAVQNSLSDRLRILCGDLRGAPDAASAQQLRRRRLQSALLSRRERRRLRFPGAGCGADGAFLHTGRSLRLRGVAA